MKIKKQKNKIIAKKAPKKASKKVIKRNNKNKMVTNITHEFNNVKDIYFFPHKPNTTIIVKDKPKIYISKQAYDDMTIIISLVNQEISWLGTVTNPSDNKYIIDEIFIVKQNCSFVTTEMSNEGLNDLYKTILNSDDGIKKANNLRLWGHSHIKMSTSPSCQDNDQMKIFSGNKCDYFIRCIGNQHGRLEFTLYRYDTGVTFIDIPWSLTTDNNDNKIMHWKKEITDKVKPINNFIMTGNKNNYQTSLYGDSLMTNQFNKELFNPNESNEFDYDDTDYDDDKLDYNQSEFTKNIPY